MKQIAVLGSTGSIGTQTLEVVQNRQDMKICALAAGKNIDLLEKQIRQFRPKLAAVRDEEDAAELQVRVADLDVRVLYGMDGLLETAVMPEADILVTAIVGMIGIRPTIAAIKAGKDIALANKETLVTAGHLIMPLIREKQVHLLPVDSEHSAIFQCLQAAGGNKPEKILLTASGGPFRTWDRERIEKATREEALKHPNWNMGAKITVDSASMFNKGLEIMEARWLFDLPEDRIEVVVHPQSIVHSAVVFKDGAVLAQLGEPDMRVPIGYAMSYPERLETGVPAPDLFALGSLTFERPDEQKFPALRLARECLRAGGAACTVFNGANEEAVAAFLRGEIPFGEIARRVERALDKLAGLPADCIEEIWEADRKAREL